MRTVRVHYSDGRLVEYAAIKDATAGLRCSADTIIAFSMGFARVAGRRLHAMGIESIEVSASRAPKPDRPEWTSAGHPVPLLITCRATGQTMEAGSMLEASRITGLANSTIKDAVGDGRWHKGYRYDLLDGGVAPDLCDSTIRFGSTPVPDDIIKQLRYMAIHYVSTYWSSSMELSREEHSEAVDYAVERAAADYSRGLYDPSRGKFGLWGYIRIKGYAANYLRRMRRWTDRRSTAPAGEDPDNWVEKQQQADEPGAQTDEEYVAELPEEYRQLAALILAGHTRYEICTIMGMPNSVLARMRRKLGEFIRLRKSGYDAQGGTGEET